MQTNHLSKKLLTALFAFTFLTVSATARQIVTPGYYHPSPLSVKYFGMKNDYLIFKVTVRKGDLKKPELFIDASNTGSLYWKKISGKTKVEWMRIKNDANLNIHFELVATNTTYYKTFTASTSVAKAGTIVSESTDIAANE